MYNLKSQISVQKKSILHNVLAYYDNKQIAKYHGREGVLAIDRRKTWAILFIKGFYIYIFFLD
jgi:hypothetical protein